MLLGVIIDCELKFEEHIMKLCRKINWKLRALSRITNFMTLEKRRLLMKAFIFAQFSYSLVWMCHSRKLNNKINRLHERTPRIV